MKDNSLIINEEGQRLLVNLAQHYDVWAEAEKQLAPGRLQSKEVGVDFFLPWTEGF